MMEKVKRICLYAVAIVILAIWHYWITLTVGFSLQAVAVYVAYLERGYYAIGSEIMVLPIVALIGYKLTPVMEVTITERGLRYHVEGKKRRISGNQKRTRRSGNGAYRRRVG